MPKAVRMVSVPAKFILNMPKRNAIFSTAASHDPSICIVAPIGMINSRISLGTPILSAACKLEGIVAIELPVAKAISEGGIMLRQNFRKPLLPAEIVT